MEIFFVILGIGFRPKAKNLYGQSSTKEASAEEREYFILAGLFDISYYFIFDRIVCVLVTFYQ